jgi:hypothetical protein
MKAKIILLLFLGIPVLGVYAQATSFGVSGDVAKADTLVCDTLFAAIFPINLFDATTREIHGLFKVPFRENIVHRTEIRVHTFVGGRDFLRLNYMLADHGYLIDSLCVNDNLIRLGFGLSMGMSRFDFNKVMKRNVTQDLVVVFNNDLTMRCLFRFRQDRLIQVVLSPEQYARSVF